MKLSCRRVSTVYKWFICGLERFNRIAFYSLVNEWQRAEPNTARQIMLLLIIISPRKKFLLLAVGNKFSTKQVYSLSFALCGYIFAAGPPFERQRCFLFHFFPALIFFLFAERWVFVWNVISLNTHYLMGPLSVVNRFKWTRWDSDTFWKPRQFVLS